jgi:ketosteroid isomerase-like protein
VGTALEVVRRQYEAFQRQDWDALFALYHPDVELDLSRSGIPDGGVHHGHDGLLEGWSKWRGVWGRYEFELEDLIEAGEDRVLALIHVRAASKGQGMDAEVRAGDVFTVRDGLIVHFANFLDREDARGEVGLA